MTQVPTAAPGAVTDEAVTAAEAATPLSEAELARIRADFPILSRTLRDGRPLVYLDSGATAQKPVAVLDAERDYYLQHNAAVHRGSHQLAEEATELFEGARSRIAGYVGARPDEVVFTSNATAAINLVAYAFSNAAAPGAMDGVDPAVTERFRLGPGDEICVTEMEHHANLVPWQELARRTGATLRWLPVGPDGLLASLDPIGPRTKVVAFAHVSNVLGTRNDVSAVCAAAREVGAVTVLDASQSVPHLPADELPLADFVAFTGHKCLGPLGIGVLRGRRELLAAMPPFLTGGSMIDVVQMERSTYLPPPHRFEAGVPMAAQAVGLAVAMDYLHEIGMERIAATDAELCDRVVEGLAERPWVRVVGPQGTGAVNGRRRVGLVAFAVDGVHPHDVSQILDDQGVAVRAGHHCAAPLHKCLALPATTRASFAAYTSRGDVDAFLTALDEVPRVFGLDRE